MEPNSDLYERLRKRLADHTSASWPRRHDADPWDGNPSTHVDAGGLIGDCQLPEEPCPPLQDTQRPAPKW
jgi:hypothetical protein